MNKEELLNLTLELSIKEVSINNLENKILRYIENFIDIDYRIEDDALIELAEMYNDLYRLKDEKEKLLTKVSIGYRCLLK